MRKVGVLVLLVVLTGCSPASQALIIHDSESGQPSIRVFLCENQWVESISLLEADFSAGWGEVDESAVLWRIEGSPLAQDRSEVVFVDFVVGETPPGFEEVVALQGSSLPKAVALHADISDSVARDHGGAFVVDQLPLVDERLLHIRQDTLERESRAECHPGILNHLGLIIDDPAWLPYAALLLLIGPVAVLAGVFAVRLRRSKAQDRAAKSWSSFDGQDS